MDVALQEEHITNESHERRDSMPGYGLWDSGMIDKHSRPKGML